MKPTSTIISNALVYLRGQGASALVHALENGRPWFIWYERGRPHVAIYAQHGAAAAILGLATRSVTGNEMEGLLDRAFDRDLPHPEWVKFHIINSKTMEQIA